jgi:NAD(P)-dependent dehydrogenase (short-subunit alcohol dehydrogenase family)
VRVLVIGGTQFMGREIVQRLAARGHEVSVLYRRDRHDLGAEIRTCRPTAEICKPSRGCCASSAQRSYVETLARVAGVEPTLVSVPRARIHAAGGHVSIGNLYFGEYLDLPPITEVVAKAPRLLGVTPTSLEAALGSSFAWYELQPRRAVDYSFEDRMLAQS